MQENKHKPSPSKHSTISSLSQGSGKKEKGATTQQGADKMAVLKLQQQQPIEMEVPGKSDLLVLIEHIDKLEGGLIEKFNGLLNLMAY